MNETPLLLAIAAGSLAVRCTLFRPDGAAIASSARQLGRSAPAPDWNEQDADAIWAALLDALGDLAKAHDLGAVGAVGLASQRGTCLLWDRATGEPLGPAISWGDRRTEAFVAALHDAGHALLVQVRTGAPLHSFYSAPKLRWMLDHLAGAGGLLAVGQLAGSTLDSWLLWKLSGGQTSATDYSNAQRTLLMNMTALSWDSELARLFGLPLEILPELRPSVGAWGSTALAQFPQLRAPIAAVVGEQAAALLGHGVASQGASLCSYGTSLVATLFSGAHPAGISEGLAQVVSALDGSTAYATRMSIGGGAQVLEWCCARLGAFASVDELLTLAGSAPGDDSVIFVPAFAGLPAPHYGRTARAAILGLHGADDRSTIARAALESIAFQMADLLAYLQAVGGGPTTRLITEGSLAHNDILMQLQADLLGMPIERAGAADPAILGTAYLAARGAGIPIAAGFLAHGRGAPRQFIPHLDPAARQRRLDLWHAAIEHTASWGQARGP